jgi:TPR repeat protein
MKDVVAGAHYYKLAAEQGHGEAQKYYGICLRDGVGVARDATAARRYLKLAAEQGFV